MFASNYEMRVMRETFPDLLSEKARFDDDDHPAQVKLGLRLPKSLFHSLNLSETTHSNVCVRALLVVRTLSGTAEESGDSWFLDSTGLGVVIPLSSFDKTYYFTNLSDPQHNYDIRINLTIHHQFANNSLSASLSANNTNNSSPLQNSIHPPNPPLLPTPVHLTRANHSSLPHSPLPHSHSPSPTSSPSQFVAGTATPPVQHTNSMPTTPAAHSLNSSALVKTRSHSPSHHHPDRRSRQPSPSPLQAPPIESRRTKSLPFSEPVSLPANGKAIGYIKTDLASLRRGDDERARVRINGMNGEFEPHAHMADLNIHWSSLPYEKISLTLEVRVKIQLGNGWPLCICVDN